MRKNILVSGLALLAGLLLAEGLVRLLHLAPGVTRIEIDKPYGTFVSSDDPILKYVPKPGSGEINAYGIRDHEYAMHKPGRTYRILVIGDSIGFGFCNDDRSLPLEAVFSKVLESLLGRVTLQGYDKIEVVNLCVSGYDTQQEVEFLERKGLALSPDLVVVQYCLNDSWIASSELFALEKSPRWGEFSRLAQLPRGLFFTSHLMRLAWYRGQILRDRLAGHSASGPASPAAEQPTPGNDHTTLGFARLEELSRAHGFKVLVVVFPWFEDYKSYTKGIIHEFVHRRAERNGFYFLDLLPVYVQRSGGDYRVLQGDCNREHPNALGHTVAAQAIVSYLLGNRVLPGARGPVARPGGR